LQCGRGGNVGRYLGEQCSNLQSSSQSYRVSCSPEPPSTSRLSNIRRGSCRKPGAAREWFGDGETQFHFSCLSETVRMETRTGDLGLVSQPEISRVDVLTRIVSFLRLWYHPCARSCLLGVLLSLHSSHSSGRRSTQSSIYGLLNVPEPRTKACVPNTTHWKSTCGRTHSAAAD
jgi:hypothetical protein